MDLARYAFFRMSASAATGTRFGGLPGLGANRVPALASAVPARIGDAKDMPMMFPSVSPELLQRGLRLHSSGGRIRNGVLG